MARREYRGVYPYPAAGGRTLYRALYNDSNGRWQSSTPGEPMDRTTVSRDWHKQALEDAGLRDMPLHSLRHPAAASWLLAGQPLIYVQRANSVTALSRSPSATTATSSRALPTRPPTKLSARSGEQPPEGLGPARPPERLGAALPGAPRSTSPVEPLLDVLLNEPDRPAGAAEANRRDAAILGGVVQPGARDLQHARDLARLQEIRHDLTILALSA